MKKLNGKIAATLVVVLAALFIAVNSCSIVNANERAVKVRLGQVVGDTLQPGVVIHMPFMTQVRIYSIVPKTYEVTFSCGGDGAITKDMQSVGSTVVVRYAYDEHRIVDIVKRYTDYQIQAAMKDNVKASLKGTVGGYSIYDLVEKQNEVTNRVATAVLDRMSDYPVTISQTTITNWDWSEDFDRQIKETANRAQEVKKAEQDLKLAETNAQKQVKVAEANLQAEKLNAEAERVKADATAYANAKMAQNLNVELKLKELEIEKLRVEKWDGHYVPTNNYGPIPVQSGSIQGESKR